MRTKRELRHLTKKEYVLYIYIRVQSCLVFVASATNLGLGTRKLPNAPASEFTSTSTATLTRTRATTWQHVPVGTHLCGSQLARARPRLRARYAPARYTQYVPTKMRIHFLQNVSHSAAHYRRNEKGMMRGGNSDKEDTPGGRKRGRKREREDRREEEENAKRRT